MQQFIPFEDDWDALAKLRPEDLVPYRVGMLRDIRANATAAFLPIDQRPACERVMKEPPVSEWLKPECAPALSDG
jgi:hypothetical protein